MEKGYKNHKLISIVQEFEKLGTEYNINGINRGKAIFFWRGKQELFEPIPRGSYRLEEKLGTLYLVITNTEELAKIERIQVGYEFASVSSKYEVEFNVELNVLKDKYNQAVEDIKTLYKYIQTNMMTADALNSSVVLPQLDTDEVWVKTADGWRGFNIGSLEERIQSAINEFKRFVEQSKAEITGLFDEEVVKGKDSISESTTVLQSELDTLYANARDNIIMTKNNSMKELQNFTKTITGEVDSYSKSEINNFKIAVSEQTRLATEAKQVLTEENGKATTNIAELKAENLSATQKISEIKSAGETAIRNIDSKKNESINAITKSTPTEIAKVSTEGDKQVKLVGDKGVGSIQAIELKKEEVIETANTKIDEIKSLPIDKKINSYDGSDYKTWIGSESDYQSLSVKENGVLYMTFDSLFNITTKYFKPKPSIVKNGLVCWLDGRDGENRNTTWKDRSGNGNDATLNNFKWTKESGFDGKGLRLDGISDYLRYKNPELSEFTLEVYGNFENHNSLNTIISGDRFAYFVGNDSNKRVGLVEWGKKEYFSSFRYIGEYFSFVKNSSEFSITQKGNTKKTLDNVGQLLQPNGESRRISPSSNFLKGIVYSIKIYNRALTPEEIKNNYEYEQSIDRTVPETLDEKIYDKDYCIGNTSDLTDEQRKTFRLSNDKTKFVNGVNNVSGIAVETYTYEEIQKIMETPEWRREEVNI